MRSWRLGCGGPLHCAATGTGGAVAHILAHMKLRDGENRQPIRPDLQPLRAAGPPAFVQGRFSAFEAVVPGTGGRPPRPWRDGGA